ncbi:hypothetical protein B9Z19DRAFT_1078918, partial [Tuber borchii]
MRTIQGAVQIPSVANHNHSHYHSRPPATDLSLGEKAVPVSQLKPGISVPQPLSH